ncbi:MAG: alpha/beta hydrolase, partial [Clostridia bacterium]|nr:alpha/beta hydrolase [Clostridia bacterium]
KVYCEVSGSGSAVLLLHGWGGKCESWAPVSRDLSKFHSVINLDFPGHGRSSDPPQPWSVSEYAHMVAGLLDSLGFDRADIIAHSFGGRVALCLGATRSEIVGKMILSGVPALKKPPSAKSRARAGLYRALKSVAASSPVRALMGDENVEKMIDNLQCAFGSEDYKALSPYMRKTFSRIIAQDLSEYIPKIASPTLLFWGEEDTAAPLWIAEEMKKIIPDAGLVAMPGAGHFAYLDRYREFWAVIDSFLN